MVVQMLVKKLHLLLPVCAARCVPIMSTMAAWKARSAAMARSGCSTACSMRASISSSRAMPAAWRVAGRLGDGADDAVGLEDFNEAIGLVGGQGWPACLLASGRYRRRFM